MKIKKKQISFLVLSNLIVLPTIVSCSYNKSNDIDALDKFVEYTFRNNIVPILTFNDSKTNFKINDLDETNKYKIEWKIKNEADELKEDIENVFKKIKIEYSHYFIPQLNKDEEAYVFFNVILKSDNRFKKSFSIKLMDLSKNSQLTIINMEKEEIKTLIESKIWNSKSIVSDLNFVIDNMLNEDRKEIEEDDQNNIIIDNSSPSEELVNLLKEQISRSIQEFNNGNKFPYDYINLYFNETELKFIVNDQTKEIKLNIPITSSKDNDLYYNFVLPLKKIN